MSYVNGAAGWGDEAPHPANDATQGQSHHTPEGSKIQQPRGFRKAVKFDAKARVALIGVSGSGKSYTMLTLARALAGPAGKIACIDTEHGSLSKYADLFQFDVAEPDSYNPDYLLEQLDFAEQNGYAVFCVDSLSHFWMGKDGALEFVDNARKRTRDQFEGWKMFRPHERSMVDRFIASPCHIVVTMRTKTDYEEQIGENGKKKRVKVGLAPIQRDGLEYEFDLVCSMDDENNLLVDKTRCSLYSSERMRVAAKPGPKYFQPFIDWLAGEKRTAPPAAATAPQAIIAPTHPPTYLEDLPDWPQGPADPWVKVRGVLYRQGPDGNYAVYVPPTPAAPAAAPALPLKAGEIRKAFNVVRERIGEVRYMEELMLAGVRDPLEFRDRNKAQECFNRMWKLAQLEDK